MSFSYKYPRLALTVDIAVFSCKDSIPKVLLIQRKNEPFKDNWALPGGFVDMDETVDEAAFRELKEETALEFRELKQFKVFSSVDRDPRGRTVSVVFVGELCGKAVALLAQDDAKDLGWFSIDSLPVLAFDHDDILKEIIADYNYY